MSVKIALAGNPNCGKTTLFNALTGSNQFVGNWPGVTVAKKEGKYKGRKAALDAAQIAEARVQINAGAKIAQVARNLEVSRQTLYSALARTPEM